MQKLSTYFTGVASKRLSLVETDGKASHQHEFNGVSGLKKIFGEEKQEFSAEFLFLDSDEELISDSGKLTWYDSREAHPSRSEYRLYYSPNEVIEKATEGDLLIIAQRNQNQVVVLVIESGSTIERQFLWLFDLIPSESFRIKDDLTKKDSNLLFLQNKILETIGIEIFQEPKHWLDLILQKFGPKFPKTKEFSQFARETFDETDPIGFPDESLLGWINHEEMLFKILESHLVQGKLESGFSNVDDFISYSLSIQNRRKSRMGFSFENHLKFLFESNELRFSTQKVTEQNSKPDFLFPGIEEYHNQSFPSESLTMLGAKSSCKERWNQVLAEANRISFKHLVTLEGGISEKQTDKMREKKLQLVIPEGIFPTFSQLQQEWLFTLEDFIQLVRHRQQ